MPFRYRLESLLRLQRSIEQQEKNRVFACAARVAKVKADLQSWQDLRLQRKTEAWLNPEQGTPSAFLQFAVEWDRIAQVREQELSRQLLEAELARQTQLRIHRAAQQKREVLESLKDRQESAYTTEQLRRVQQALDEAHLIRSVYWTDG